MSRTAAQEASATAPLKLSRFGWQRMTACFGVRDIERFLLLKRLASWWPGQAICSQEHIHSLPSDLGRRTIGAAQAPKSRNAAIQKARSEEHTSELQSLMRISYAVFCLKKK